MSYFQLSVKSHSRLQCTHDDWSEELSPRSRSTECKNQNQLHSKSIYHSFLLFNLRVESSWYAQTYMISLSVTLQDGEQVLITSYDPLGHSELKLMSKSIWPFSFASQPSSVTCSSLVSLSQNPEIPGSKTSPWRGS